MVNFLSVILVLFSTFLGAFAAMLIKKGAGESSWKEILFSQNFLKGLFLYLLSSVLYLTALRLEVLTLVYPLTSLGYLWTTFLSVKYLHEKMNLWKWLGLMGIIFGVILVGFGS